MPKTKSIKTPTRRQKSPEKREKLFVVLAWLFISVCVVIISFLTYTGGYVLFFSTNQHYTLKKIDFSSEGMISEKLVEETIRKQHKEKTLNLYSLSPALLRQDLLKAHPAIEDVKVIRKFPDSLKIDIAEKPVIARIYSQGEQWTLTENGMALKPGNRVGIKALPVIHIAGLKKLTEGHIINKTEVLEGLKMLKHSMTETFTINETNYTFRQILDIRNMFIRKDSVMLIVNENKKFRVARNSRVIISLDEYKLCLSRAWNAAFEQSKSKVPYNYIDATNRNVAIRVVNTPIPQ